METAKKNTAPSLLLSFGNDFANRLGEKSWTYTKTVVDAGKEPLLVLDKDQRVLGANDSFYETFQVEPADTERKMLYELGNGQWNIPALRKLLEAIVPLNTFFKGFEVTHAFPFIGRKIMMLSARQIYYAEAITAELFPPVVLLVIEDITDMMAVAETLAGHAKQLELRHAEHAEKLERHIKKLQEEIVALKKGRHVTH